MFLAIVSKMDAFISGALATLEQVYTGEGLTKAG